MRTSTSDWEKMHVNWLKIISRRLTTPTYTCTMFSECVPKAASSSSRMLLFCVYLYMIKSLWERTCTHLSDTNHGCTATVTSKQDFGGFDTTSDHTLAAGISKFFRLLLAYLRPTRVGPFASSRALALAHKSTCKCVCVCAYCESDKTDMCA
jgi:hypothetical protein